MKRIKANIFRCLLLLSFFVTPLCLTFEPPFHSPAVAVAKDKDKKDKKDKKDPGVSIPEPATWLLISAGAAGVWWLTKKSRRKKS